MGLRVVACVHVAHDHDTSNTIIFVVLDQRYVSEGKGHASERCCEALQAAQLFSFF